MPERIIAFVQPVKDRWNGLEKVQKIQIAAIAAVILIAIIIAVFLTTRTTYRVALGGLDHIELMQIEALMDEHGIRNRSANNGTAIEVEDGRVMEARALIESRGIMAARDFTFEDALDFSGIGVTEHVTRQNMLRAAQTDLEVALAAFDGVLSARVELSLPDANRFFVQTADRATASVILMTSRVLSRQEGEAIARFVRRGVLGLDMENIVVLDTNFNVLFNGEELENEDSAQDFMLELASQSRTMVNAMVREMFAAMYPIVNVAPNLQFHQTMTEFQRHEWAAPIPEMEGGLLQYEIAARASAQGMQSAWEPGLGPLQTATIPSYPWAFPQEMQASQQEHQRNFALNEFIETGRSMPTGYIPELSSISINLARPVIIERRHLMEANGGSFSDTEWSNVMNTTAHELIELPDAQIALYQNLVRDATGITDVTIAAWTVPQFIDYAPTPIAFDQIIMYAILALLLALLAFALIRRTQPEDEEEIEPELSVEDLLVSTQMEEALEDELLETINFNQDTEAKQKLDAFIDEKPEAAASLLRHWLNEAEV